MKYLKLYEAVWEYSLKTYLLERYGKDFQDYLSISNRLSCNEVKLTDLDGLEYLTNITSFSCSTNRLKSLKGIENLTNLTSLSCYSNQLKNLKELENLINLEEIDCGINELKSLEGIENLRNLKSLDCDQNQLKNLDELINLNLRTIHSYQNPFECPIKIEIIKKILHAERTRIYDPGILKKFGSYEYQKEFLEEHPERIQDLILIGFNDKIKEEYKELISFFNIKE